MCEYHMMNGVICLHRMLPPAATDSVPQTKTAGRLLPCRGMHAGLALTNNLMNVSVYNDEALCVECSIAVSAQFLIILK